MFPNRCIFTNEAVAEHSRVKLASVKVAGAPPILLVTKDECFLSIPLSDTWRRQKIGLWLFLALTLKVIGVCSILGCLFVPAALGLDITESIFIGISGLIYGSVVTFVGFYIPHLEDTVDVNCVYRVQFLKNGLIVIPDPSKDFLKGLPVAKLGWLHGFLDFESILLPDAREKSDEPKL